MATKIISQENRFEKFSLEHLVSFASEAIEDIDVMQNKLYCVASAGKAFCNEETTTESRLFEVIEDIAGSTRPLCDLRKILAAIVQHAEGARHA